MLSALDENAEEDMAAEETADVTVLRARVKHLEMQQSLMDRELESMSDLARQSDSQLRCADSCSLTHNAVNSVVILPPDPLVMPNKKVLSSHKFLFGPRQRKMVKPRWALMLL